MPYQWNKKKAMENQMIILIDADKAFDKTQCSL